MMERLQRWILKLALGWFLLHRGALRAGLADRLADVIDEVVPKRFHPDVAYVLVDAAEQLDPPKPITGARKP